LRLIGAAFMLLACYLGVQSAIVLAIGYHPHHSVLGIAWTAMTAVVMFLLARGKSRVGDALNNAVLATEGRVTLVDAVLATAVLIGLVLNAGLGWWWADPLAGFVIVIYGVKEGVGALRHASLK
ncbi:MAG: cation transporter, partial [Acidimicrobiales bacterium]